MTQTIVVLVVEDMPRFHQQIQKKLLDSGLVQEVIVAESIIEATGAFDGSKSRLTAVLMDACIEKDKPDTLELTQYIRANFTGVIVAMSRDPGYRREQMRAGCNHQSPKHEVAEYLLKYLGTRIDMPAPSSI